MNLTETQVIALAPDDSSLKAGKSLSERHNWVSACMNERVLWGEIKGSGSKPYQTQIDLLNLAYKCSCPSRKFPCKHGIGLMLLASKNKESIFITDNEPDWVKEWIDQRNSKIQKQEKVNSEEQSEKDKESSLKAKQKRADERRKQVDEGAQELLLWIKDIVKTGMLNLKTKERSYFTRMMARMVDYKATGLSNLVRELRDLDYTTNNAWHDEALRILSRIYLLIQAYKNVDNLEAPISTSILNLIGWNQSPKELMADEQNQGIHDNWIILGLEEDQIDDILVQRNWIYGINTNKTGVLLNFISRFTQAENLVVPGTIIEANMVFFEAAFPQRALLKSQKSILPQIPNYPEMYENFDQALKYVSEVNESFPFVKDKVVIIQNLDLFKDNNNYFVVDQQKNFMRLAPMGEKALMNFSIFNREKPLHTSGVIRLNTFYALGVFDEAKYIVL